MVPINNAYFASCGCQHANFDLLGLWCSKIAGQIWILVFSTIWIEADFRERLNVGPFYSGKENHETWRAAEALGKSISGLIGAIYEYTLPAPAKNADPTATPSLVALDFLRSEENAS